jgi:hypothetical protein
MSAMAEGWSEPRSRSRWVLFLIWWAAAAAGGLAGGLLPNPFAGAAVSAALVGLLQALAFRPDLRYGAAWFGSTAIAGAIGFAAMLVGALAFSEISGGEPGLLRQGLAAWIGLSALGGLLLAGAQAPLAGRRNLTIGWCALGLFAGAVLWPAGFATGHRFGPELALLLFPLERPAGEPSHSVAQAAAFALAWFFHSVPFGILVASSSAER